MCKRNVHLWWICALLFFSIAVPAGAQPPEGGDRVLITNRSFRQIFEPYLFPQGPIFVTGDAVLQGFNTLLAQSIDRFEQAGSSRLLPALRLMLLQVTAGEQQTSKTAERQASGSRAGQTGESETAADGYPGMRQRARLLARTVISVALQLIGDEKADLEAEIATLVENEVRRVQDAQGVYFPEWLASPDDGTGGIDYSAFRPHGYYQQSETLQRYYRTVRWLQSIPFRIDSDEELLAILLLSKAIATTQGPGSEDRRAAEHFFRCYRELFGRKNDRDLLFAAGILKDRPADLDTVRLHLQSASDGRSQERQPPGPGPFRDALYIISPSRLPDEQFFRRRQQTEGFTYTDPSGLELCALLGSDYARNQLGLRLPAAFRRSLQVEIDRFSETITPDGLYNQYMITVAALLDPPEPDAPAFTREQAWAAKNCNTALAGWVHQRKSLPPKRRPPGETIEELFNEVPAGFVEPDPEFFDRLGELTEQVINILDRCRALPAPAAQFAAWLRQFERMLAADRFPVGTDDDRAQKLTSEEMAVVDSALKILSTLAGLRVDPTTAGRRKEEMRVAAAATADALVRGQYDQDPTYQALVIESGMDLGRRWRQLGRMCRRLEVMAHKQLRGVAFNDKETYFLSDFGFALAAVMLYGGDSYRHPRDDAPLAFTYHFDPRSKKHLHAAVARPREIIVPYPLGGRYVPCRGAVMPFYEFIAATDITDDQWRKRLDSDERPSALRWLDPVMQTGDPEKSWRRAGTPELEPAPDMQ